MSMETEYRSFDFSKIQNRKRISAEESMKDIEPMAFSEDVLNGKNRIVVTLPTNTERRPQTNELQKR